MTCTTRVTRASTRATALTRPATRGALSTGTQDIPSNVRAFARSKPSRKQFYEFCTEYTNKHPGSYGPGIHAHWADKLGLRKVRSRLGSIKRSEAITFNNTVQVNANNASVVSAVQYGNLTPHNLRHLAPPSSIADVSMRSPSVALSTRSCSMGVFNKRPKSTGSSLSTILSMVDGEVSTETQVSPLCSESARIDALEKQIRILSHMLSVATFQLDSLYSMTADSTFNREKRKWFISNYKNEIQEADDDDRRILTAMNSTGNDSFRLSPNAIADATLYKEKKRCDVSHFKKLYGLDPLRVLSISDDVTISILNKHASIAATEHRHRLSPIFQSFLHELENANYPENFLVHPLSITTAAQQPQQLETQRYARVADTAYAFIQEFREALDVFESL